MTAQPLVEQMDLSMAALLVLCSVVEMAVGKAVGMADKKVDKKVETMDRQTVVETAEWKVEMKVDS